MFFLIRMLLLVLVGVHGCQAKPSIRERAMVTYVSFAEGSGGSYRRRVPVEHGILTLFFCHSDFTKRDDDCGLSMFCCRTYRIFRCEVTQY